MASMTDPLDLDKLLKDAEAAKAAYADKAFRPQAIVRHRRNTTPEATIALLDRLKAAETALREIKGGIGSDAFPLPDIMELSPDDFRHAMWVWSQARARAALPEDDPHST